MKKALIIQEDIILLKIIERLVVQNGFKCRCIRRIEELNIEDQQENFDLIISDILFNGISPLDFVFQLREVIMHKSLVIVTNMGQLNVRLEVMASKKVDGFFSIPIDMNLIQKIIINDR